MKDLEKILGNIEITEEQIKALDIFFEDYKTKIENNVKKSITNEDKDVDLSKYVLKKDAEKSFDLFYEDAEKAFDLFKKDCEKAFDLATNDLQKEYTENMTKALHEVYVDIEERVKHDFFESVEFKTLEKVKQVMAPILLNEEQKEMLDQWKTLEEEKKSLNEEKQEIKREKIISTLMKEFPVEYAEQVKTFISGAKSNNEIYERFNLIVEMIENGGDTKGVKTFKRKTIQPVIEEVTANIKEKKFVKKEKVSPIFESESITADKVVKPKENKFDGFDDREKAMMEILFPNVQ